MKQEYHDNHDYCFSPALFSLKTIYKCVKLFLNVSKNGKSCMISDDYHDIGLITIIASSKNLTISIIVKQNIIGKTG